MRKRGGGTKTIQCEGKTAYRSKAEAIRRIEFQMGNRRRLKRHGHNHMRLEAYHCRFCGQWHVGSATDWRGVHQQILEERMAKKIDMALSRYV